MSPTNALREALEQIAALQARWQAPTSSEDTADSNAKWAAVGSEAHGIAVDALAAVPAEPEPAREIQRRECIACGSPIEQFRAPKSRGIVTVIGCRNGCGFVLDREGTRRPYAEVSRLATYREVVPAEPEAWEWEDRALNELGQRIAKARTKRASLGLPTCADELPSLRKLTALMEEVGEVAEAIQVGEGHARLRDELFDVAVCSLLWAATVRDDEAGPWERVDLRARLCPISGDDCPREGPTHSDGSPFGPCDECPGRPQDGGEHG